MYRGQYYAPLLKSHEYCEKKTKKSNGVSECNSVYAFICLLGDVAIKLVAGFLGLILKIVSTPFKWLIKLIKLQSRKSEKKAKEYNLDGAYYAWESQEGGFEGGSD